MKIANPSYDIVFKFMLEDNEVAKLFLSLLIKKEIVELEFKPKEFVKEVKIFGKEFSLKFYRLDFKAKIRTKEGELKVLLIEVQKAQLPDDIVRFREYLGNQYALKDNIIREENGRYFGIPIITIYFLGYELEVKSPLIRVERVLKDYTTENRLTGSDKFIDSLTHESIIIQIPLLRKQKARDDLEKLLQIFDERRIKVKEIFEQEYPISYQKILKRLNMAVMDAEVIQKMQEEDTLITAIEETIEYWKKQADKYRKDNIVLMMENQEHKRLLQEKEALINELLLSLKQLKEEKKELQAKMEELIRQHKEDREELIRQHKEEKAMLLAKIEELIRQHKEDREELIRQHKEEKAMLLAKIEELIKQVELLTKNRSIK